MSAPGSGGPGRLAEIAVVLIGLVFTIVAFRLPSLMGLFAIGVGLIIVGAGVWARDRWARWLALGVCFLMVLNAWVLPIVIFVIRPVSAGHSPHANLGWGALAIAVGVAGYKGLAWLRSQRARFEFGSTPEGREELYREPSTAIAYSAALCAAVIGVVMAFSLTGESAPPAAAVPEETSVAATADRPARPSGRLGGSPWTEQPAEPPRDLIVIGLCAVRGGDIDLLFTNRGGPARGHIHVARGRTVETARVRENLLFPIPAEGVIQRFEVGRIADFVPEDGRPGDVAARVDPLDELPETDETNNSASARVRRLPDGRSDLPDCDIVESNYRAYRRVADNAVQPAGVSFPDLVPVGICRQRNGGWYSEFGLVYGNTGPVSDPANVSFVATHDPDPMGVWSNDVLGVPSPGTYRIANLSLRPDRAPPWIRVRVDVRNVVVESDEANNERRFELPRNSDGSLALPSCDELPSYGDRLARIDPRRYQP